VQAWLFQNSFLQMLAPAQEFVAVIGHFAHGLGVQGHRLHSGGRHSCGSIAQSQNAKSRRDAGATGPRGGLTQHSEESRSRQVLAEGS
jgi:hypothetical protein